MARKKKPPHTDASPIGYRLKMQPIRRNGKIMYFAAPLEVTSTYRPNARKVAELLYAKGWGADSLRERDWPKDLVAEVATELQRVQREVATTPVLSATEIRDPYDPSAIVAPILRVAQR